MFRTAIPHVLARFIEALPFFFMATADARGACDCSFRSREHDASGRTYPCLKVLDASTLVFPDYAGNKLFNSLGNILVNPQIGCLHLQNCSLAVKRRLGRMQLAISIQQLPVQWQTIQRQARGVQAGKTGLAGNQGLGRPDIMLAIEPHQIHTIIIRSAFLIQLNLQ